MMGRDLVEKQYYMDLERRQGRGGQQGADKSPACGLAGGCQLVWQGVANWSALKLK